MSPFEGMGAGMLLVLLVRGFLASVPKIIESASKAMAAREESKRISAETKLAEVNREVANDGRIDTLRSELDKMREEIAEKERLATEAIHSTQIEHAQTKERLRACEEDLEQCTREHASTKRAMNALHQDMQELKKQIGASHAV